MAGLSLLRRMIEDMTVGNLSPATQRSYISALSKFSRYFRAARWVGSTPETPRAGRWSFDLTRLAGAERCPQLLPGAGEQ